MVRAAERPCGGQGNDKPHPHGAGNLSSVKEVGEGIFESRIDFGPGCRIYFGRDGEALIILLGGGIKKRQQRDIETARARWREYKRRKRQES